MKNSNQAIDIIRAQYTAIRAWLQGVAAVDVADRWLSADPDIEWTESLALHALRAIRAALTQLALCHKQEALASLLVTGSRSTTALNQVLAGLRRLEELDTPAPTTKYDVRLWFTAPLTRRLQATGVATSGELMTLASDLGRAWWRRVPCIGLAAAATTVRTPATAEATLGRLGVHVTGVSLPAALPSPELVPHAGRVVPLKAIRLSAALDGRAGVNRDDISRCHIDALNGYQTIQTWLLLWPTGGHTWRACRKKAERCLVWAILERGKAFSDLLTDGCLTYRAFLVQKDFGPRWSGPQVVRIPPGWWPFQGPLPTRSRAYAEQVLVALCEWLVGHRYLDPNLWDGMPALRVAALGIDTERAMPPAVWQALQPWLDAQAADDTRWRTIRAAVLLLHDSGMRVFEAAGAEWSGLRPAGGNGPLWSELCIAGKRTKTRMVSISRRAHDALVAHWRDLGDEHAVEGLLLALAEPCTSPRALAKAVDDRRGYSDRGLCHPVARAGEAFRVHLEQADPDLHAQAIHLYPHAFRHAFGTAGAEAGVLLDMRQGYLGHASPATSAIYDKAGARRRQREVAKLLSV